MALNFFQKFWTVLDFLQKPLAWFSKFYLRVQSKTCGRNIFCYSSFLRFSYFERKIFQTFGQKTSRTCQNYLPSTCPEEQFAAWSFFLGFESFRIFCRNLWHGSQNSIYVSRVKFAEEIFFIILPFWFFSDFERKFFQTFGQKTSRTCQNYLPSTCPEEQFVAGSFFLSFESFRIFCRNLWHGSSKIYLSVQSNKCGRNSFFLFFFSEFFRILSKTFSDFWPKNFKNLWKRPFACPHEQLVALKFLKSFEPFWIFYRKLWHGSQNSIYVSRVKFAEELFFLFLLSEFFRILSEKFFRLLAKKLQDFVKTTFYASRGTICGLKFFLSFEAFRIFCRNLRHGSQKSI